MYANVALLVLLYGAPVWADATKVAYRHREDPEKGRAEVCYVRTALFQRRQFAY